MENEQKLENELTELYKNGLIVINGYEFYPYEISGFGNTNTKTYAITPTRGEDFSISNINDIPTAEIPRLRLNFDIMSLDVWRRLKLAMKPNEFPVTYYDWEYDRVVTHKMYFASQDDIDIFQNFGVRQEYYIMSKKTVDIVGTMNGLDTVTVTYNANGGNGTVTSHSVSPNELFNLSNGSGLTRPNYTLIKWNTSPNGDGADYQLGMGIIISENLLLYAVWQPTDKRNLSFDYQGATQQPRDTDNSNWVINKEVTYNQAVSTLPNPKFNLTKGDTLVQVTDLLGWWNIPYDWKTNGLNHTSWLAEQIQNSQPGAIKKYDSGTIYNVNGNSTIYAHWKPYVFTLTFNSNGGTTYSPRQSYYGESIDRKQYQPTKAGKTFAGWYVDDKLQVPFNWVMKGENFTIYAKWE